MLDRRSFLSGGAGLAAVAAAGALAGPAGPALAAVRPSASAATAGYRGKRHVAILGGGCAGLSAAHELVDRGFTVDVYERYAVAGGKCRSISVPGSASGGRLELPGEHGFRFFPGYYRHVIDTMSRIPYGSNPQGVKGNLVFGESALFSQKNRIDTQFPYKHLNTVTPTDLIAALVGLFGALPGLNLLELTNFATRVVEFATAGDARRIAEYEHVSWWDFVDADCYGEQYKKLLASSLTRNLVAAQAQKASTLTIGLQATRILINNIVLSMYDEASRLLNGPTTEAWIDPWLTHLKGKGLNWYAGTNVEALHLDSSGALSGATISSGGQRRTITADIYVLAVPVERARQLLDAPLRAKDPAFAKLDALEADWMTGIQYFLSQKLPIARGHVTYVDSPWALTSVSQGQFWNRDLSKYGKGQVRDIVSVDVSNWDAKGILYGKTAKQCTKDQIFKEVWAQMKQSLDWGLFISDSIVVDRFLDPGITFGPNGTPIDNAEPLMVNTVSSLANRPGVTTKVPNLFLASDYVRTNTDLATMEGANEAARRAVNAILDATSWTGARATVWNIEESALLAGARRDDDRRFSQGLPHILADRRPAGVC
jgi:uncharacterized protein with NAD-binding domain and iron-sulfur cluster